ncbi:tRNA-modifying protein YgfZ [Motilimonas cestriensis]|uniref:tRNA-modifying protein YgfZ n=1 Tax=Motilimonas cestriensis TaxID=2742685 RepID=A0ABS8WG34_9GAMM|nr:tRNA-modifying protein YgfZ [Motilimonas cestriensis]MCE2597317.1 tRNA-modifying protein YgfZ [Motilimonas cestriensis]
MRDLNSLENISLLPDLALCKLDSWDLISVRGEDRVSFLQGQLTCDVSKLEPGQQTMAAQCNAQGKTISVFRLIVLEDRILLTQPKSVSAIQLPALKKFAVFSKVEIEIESEYQMLGLLGAKSGQYIAQHIDAAAAHDKSRLLPDGALIKQPYPSLRYLVILKNNVAETVLNELTEHAELFTDGIWNALNIASGVGFIEEKISSEFIPQALNLEELDGICFTKGCYIGQETIARAKYRGANKRAMFILTGRASDKPNTGDTIELKLGDNWKRVGQVISGCQYGDLHIELLAVLPKDSDANNSQFRIKEQPESTLYIAPLPYATNQE